MIKSPVRIHSDLQLCRPKGGHTIHVIRRDETPRAALCGFEPGSKQGKWKWVSQDADEASVCQKCQDKLEVRRKPRKPCPQCRKYGHDEGCQECGGVGRVDA